MEYGHKYGELPVEPGFKAPDFRLRDENGHYVSLQDLIGRQCLVLVFIRAVDDAHTGELLDYLKDSYERIKYHCADVIAISPGSEKFNLYIAKKHRLPFHILGDEDCQVLKRYQIFNEYDKLDGPCMFILNGAGMITYMYNGKNPEDIVSMADVIHELHDLQAA
jgi:peroxiredoxin Q/BCP